MSLPAATAKTVRNPEDLLYWCGKDVRTMTRDELEAALRQAAVLYDAALKDALSRGRFAADMMRLAASR